MDSSGESNEREDPFFPTISLDCYIRVSFLASPPNLKLKLEHDVLDLHHDLYYWINDIVLNGRKPLIWLHVVNFQNFSEIYELFVVREIKKFNRQQGQNTEAISRHETGKQSLVINYNRHIWYNILSNCVNNTHVPPTSNK